MTAGLLERERFIADASARVRILWGACEALFTPRPLGPLYDIAQQTQGPHGDVVAFRHELARQAVENTLSPTRRRTHHAAVLRALLAHEDEQAALARLAHHATAARDAALVLRFAPEAARQASAQGTHREAAAHYQTALHYADQMAPEQQAELLEALSHERYLAGRVRDAVQPCEAALARCLSQCSCLQSTTFSNTF